MTNGQKRFADEYLIDLNATRAYKAAYKSVKKDETAASNGSRMLRNDKVKEYIDKKLREIQSSKIASAEEVLQYLTDVVRGAEMDTIAAFTKDGLFLERETAASLRERTKAAELLGKRYSIFTEKQEITHTVSLEDMQLLEKMARLVDKK